MHGLRTSSFVALYALCAKMSDRLASSAFAFGFRLSSLFNLDKYRVYKDVNRC